MPKLWERGLSASESRRHRLREGPAAQQDRAYALCARPLRAHRCAHRDHISKAEEWSGYEVGLEVDNIEYYKSQPWGVAGDILSGYWCDVVGDPTLHMDASELGRAVWAGPNEIPGQGDDLSLTNEMMCLWRDTHRQG